MSNNKVGRTPEPIQQLTAPNINPDGADRRTFGTTITNLLNPLKAILGLLTAQIPKSPSFNARPFQSDEPQSVESVRQQAGNIDPYGIQDLDSEDSRYWTAFSSTFSHMGLERTTSSESVSTANAIKFKLIHYEAALDVLKELVTKINPHAHRGSIEQFSTMIERAAHALRKELSEHSSAERTFVKAKIGGKHRHGKLTDFFRKFKHEQTLLIQVGSRGNNIPEQTRFVHIRTALASMMHGKFRSIGLHAKHLSVEALDKAIFNRYINALQSADWKNISCNHELRFTTAKGDSSPVTFKSKMTTAKNLDEVLARKYRTNNVQGICSYATQEDRHAVNLWRTEFQPETGNDRQQQYRFSGIRHAVHDAYGLKDPAGRVAANDARVQEFIHACVIDHMKRNGLDPQQIDPRKALNIDVISVNLLTSKGKENEMLRQQQQAFARVNQQEMTLHIADHAGLPYAIKVKPTIVMFNTPVNCLSLSPAGNLLGIWRSADKINQNALEILLGSGKKHSPLGGMVASRIHTLKAELAIISGNRIENKAQRTQIKKNINLIEKLAFQIKEIHWSKSHHRVGNEPYKLSTRLLALANEIGAVPAFNCKSGKDRTGQLNVEIRDFYAHLNGSNGELRAVNHRRQGLDQDNFQKLFIAGGDREIQTLNTGVPGSKAQLPYYNKLMGITPKTIDEIRGLSRWVGT